MGDHIVSIIGIFCVIAAITDGAIKFKDVFELPRPSSFIRQILLSIFGLLLVIYDNRTEIREWLAVDRHLVSPQPDVQPNVTPDKQKDKPTGKAITDNQSSTKVPKDSPPAPKSLDNTDLRLDGFTCDINSYGTEQARDWALDQRKRLADRGCSFSTGYLVDGARPGYFADYKDGPAWKGFAARNTVFYYNPNNRDIAVQVAKFLGGDFDVQPGGGQGISSNYRNRVLMVHYRDE